VRSHSGLDSGVASFSFSSPRRFSVWRYEIGHGTLLFRSVRDDSHPTRVDVVVVGVAALKLPTDLVGLVLREASGSARDSALRGANLPAAAMSNGELRVFLIGAGEVIGYVIGLNAESHEDQGSYFDPSYWDLPRHAATPGDIPEH